MNRGSSLSQQAVIQRVIRMRKSSGYTRCWLELHHLWLGRIPDRILYSSHAVIYSHDFTWFFISKSRDFKTRSPVDYDKSCLFHQESKTTQKAPWQPQNPSFDKKAIFWYRHPYVHKFNVTILKCLIPFLQTMFFDFLSTQAFIVPLLIVQNLQLMRFQHDAG